MKDRDVFSGLWSWRVGEVFATMSPDVVLEGAGLATALERVGCSPSMHADIRKLALQDFLELAIGNFAKVFDGDSDCADAIRPHVLDVFERNCSTKICIENSPDAVLSVNPALGKQDCQFLTEHKATGLDCVGFQLVVELASWLKYLKMTAGEWCEEMRDLSLQSKSTVDDVAPESLQHTIRDWLLHVALACLPVLLRVFERVDAGLLKSILGLTDDIFLQLLKIVFENHAESPDQDAIDREIERLANEGSDGLLRDFAERLAAVSCIVSHRAGNREEQNTLAGNVDAQDALSAAFSRMCWSFVSTHDGAVSLEQFAAALQKLELDACAADIQRVFVTSQPLRWRGLEAAVKKMTTVARARKNLRAWVHAEVNLDRLVSESFSVEDDYSQPETQAWCKGLLALDSEHQLQQALVHAAHAAVGPMWQKVRRLQELKRDTAGSGLKPWGLDKFAPQADLAPVKTFYDGLEGVVGPPNTNVLETMRREHASRAPFRVTNYQVEEGGHSTTPSEEWDLVVGVEEGAVAEKARRVQQQILARYGVWRELLGVEHYLRRHLVRRAQLTLEEVIAIRLYSGPMFVLYNAKLRGFPRDICSALPARAFTTTIHAISSAILKVSMASPVPRDGLAYRGMKGVKLPQRLWRRDATGCKGGTERGFCSTTTDVKVAVRYASGGAMPVLFQIGVGQIDHGADVSELSQFPSEREILLPPLANFELKAEPYMQLMEDTEVMVVPLSLNVNTKALTMAELIARRQRLHIAMLDTFIDESRQLLADSRDALTGAEAPSAEPSLHLDRAHITTLLATDALAARRSIMQPARRSSSGSHHPDAARLSPPRPPEPSLLEPRASASAAAAAAAEEEEERQVEQLVATRRAAVSASSELFNDDAAFKAFLTSALATKRLTMRRIRLLRCVQARGHGKAWLDMLEPRASLGFGTLADDFVTWARVTSMFSEIDWEAFIAGRATAFSPGMTVEDAEVAMECWLECVQAGAAEAQPGLAQPSELTATTNLSHSALPSSSPPGQTHTPAGASPNPALQVQRPSRRVLVSLRLPPAHPASAGGAQTHVASATANTSNLNSRADGTHGPTVAVDVEEVSRFLASCRSRGGAETLLVLPPPARAGLRARGWEQATAGPDVALLLAPVVRRHSALSSVVLAGLALNLARLRSPRTLSVRLVRASCHRAEATAGAEEEEEAEYVIADAGEQRAQPDAEESTGAAPPSFFSDSHAILLAELIKGCSHLTSLDLRGPLNRVTEEGERHVAGAMWGLPQLSSLNGLWLSAAPREDRASEPDLWLKRAAGPAPGGGSGQGQRQQSSFLFGMLGGADAEGLKLSCAEEAFVALRIALLPRQTFIQTARIGTQEIKLKVGGTTRREAREKQVEGALYGRARGGGDKWAPTMCGSLGVEAKLAFVGSACFTHPSISKLRLKNQRVRGRQLRWLLQRPAAPDACPLTHIVDLLVENNPVGVEGACMLAGALPLMPKLACLQLRGSELGDRGCEALSAGLRLARKLHHLNLARNEIGAPGLAALLPALQNMTHLKILGLANNCAPAASLVALAQGISGIASLRNFRASGQQGFLPLEEALQNQIQAILPSKTVVEISQTNVPVRKLTELAHFGVRHVAEGMQLLGGTGAAEALHAHILSDSEESEASEEEPASAQPTLAAAAGS